jgi:small subunit ribosomal protein S6e|tara:strand:+ start:9123 stop:9776 length:654 start_codon:yes stop_codon:yes gene_type:complete
MTFKIVVADPKTGKSYKIETDEKSLLGLKIGEKFQGDALGLAGYELELTGGSDKTGTPMRKDVKGSSARRLLLSEGVGFHTDRPGERRKKRVFGYKLGADIVQVNFKVVKVGAQPLDKLIAPAKTEEAGKDDGGTGAPDAGAPKEEAAPAEKPAEAPAAEEKKEEAAPKEEAKPEEKPAEEKKEEGAAGQRESGAAKEENPNAQSPTPNASDKEDKN